MEKRKLGLALCGSFCTFSKAMAAAKALCDTYEVTPILSEISAVTDTRFGKASSFLQELEEYAGKPAICSIRDAEPIGPKALLDVLVIAPCTGNTLAKLAHGITDSTVTMAAKAHLRNGRPLVIAVSTNDGLAASAPNIGTLLGRKNIYFVPFHQDSPIKKPTSLVADFDLIGDTVEAALRGSQLQPLLLG